MFEGISIFNCCKSTYPFLNIPYNERENTYTYTYAICVKSGQFRECVDVYLYILCIGLLSCRVEHDVLPLDKK